MLGFLGQLDVSIKRCMVIVLIDLTSPVIFYPIKFNLCIIVKYTDCYDVFFFGVYSRETINTFSAWTKILYCWFLGHCLCKVFQTLHDYNRLYSFISLLMTLILLQGHGHQKRKAESCILFLSFYLIKLNFCLILQCMNKIMPILISVALVFI